jgi:MerR family copper efflux transcriptional regulator
MNIGDVAERTGLPAKTIRYYEEIGLIAPDRDANGYRRFGASHLHKLGFLARARSLGFSIEDCRTLLALWEDRGPRLGGRESRRAERSPGRDRPQDDGTFRNARARCRTLSACAGDDRPDCPILKGLAKPPKGTRALSRPFIFPANTGNRAHAR